MSKQVSLKTLIGAVALVTLPMSAMAGAGQVWSKQQQDPVPNSVIEETTRNWTHNAQEPVGSPQPEARVLSSTELGMHFAHGAGKDSTSTKVFVPNVTFWIQEPKEASNNDGINKRAKLLELKEAQIKSEGKTM